MTDIGPRATCSTCPAYESISRTCRAGPPTVTLVPSPNGGVGIQPFPPATDAAWCMRHPKNAPLMEPVRIGIAP
jgi:hypothetical protein